MKYVGLYDNDKDIVTKEKLDAAVPTKTSQLENDSGFITSAPVTSVNTKTGAVELTASDVGAQDKVTVEGILKGDGTGGITVAVANVEYATCTKLLNGRAIGSLRTSGAAAEDSTYTMGQNAFAQGNITKASGNYSHAEGSGTMATALMSHAEGVATIASGYASHAEGVGTTANHNSQHAQGQFNIADNSTADSTDRGNYAYIVGNGTSDTERSNAHTLDWSGNAWFAGDVYVGSTSGKNKDDGSKKLITADEVPAPATTTPLVDGTAAAGTSTDYARADHVHPIDTTRVPIARKINNKALTSDITLTADDVEAIPSTLTGTAGQVLTKTADGQEWADAEKEIFIATYDTTTYAEIKAAYDAGKAVFYKNIDVFCPLSFISDNEAKFGNIDNLTAYTIEVNASNEWGDSTNTLVPTTRKINNKSLSSNIQLGHTYNTTLTSSGWTSSSGTLAQTLTVSGIVATYNAAPSIDLALDKVVTSNKKSVADAWGKISGYMEANTAANSITFTVYADTAPTVDIPIRITTYD